MIALLSGIASVIWFELLKWKTTSQEKMGSPKINSMSSKWDCKKSKTLTVRILLFT
jgi:hypothetical protein